MRALGGLAAITVLLLGARPVAAAENRLRVALLPFDGAQAERAHNELKRTLEKLVDLASEATAAAAAQKNGTGDPGKIAAVAEELGVRVVIFGSVRRATAANVLAVEIRDDTGGVIRVLEYSFSGGRPDRSTLKAMRKDVESILAVEIARSAEPVAPEATEPVAPTVPPYLPPYVDGSFGLLLTGRQFGFGKNAFLDGLATCKPGGTNCPSYKGDVAGGLRIDLTLFPLRLFASGRPLWKYLIGLGVGATWDVVAWPDSIDAKSPPTACGGSPTCHFATSEQRIEVGLRYRWRFLARAWSPLLLASLQYGFHTFAIDPAADGMTIVPAVGYSYLDLGAGLLVPIAGRASIAVSVNGHPLSTGGAIESAKEYGPARIYGVRGDLAAQLLLWRGLSLRFSGFYEVMWLSFEASGTSAKTTDGSARDSYWGATIGAGYAY